MPPPVLYTQMGFRKPHCISRHNSSSPLPLPNFLRNAPRDIAQNVCSLDTRKRSSIGLSATSNILYETQDETRFNDQATFVAALPRAKQDASNRVF